jgi:phosphatidylglycerophosphatase A
MVNYILSLKNDICYIFGTFFGIGFMPWMPGTFASIAVAILWFIMPEYYFYNPTEGEIFYDRYLVFLAILILFSWVCVHISTVCERKYGKDASCIVIDEVAGYLFACVFLPKTMMVAIYALVLFRIFDIAKPLYINRLQNLPNGWGIMLDDVGAGITANIILQILYIWKPIFFR